MNLGFRTVFLMAAALGGFANSFSETLTLEQVIRETCTKSDSAKMMRETVVKSQETVRQDWAAALPSVSASVSAARLYGIGVGLETGSASFPASKPLDSAQAAAYVTNGELQSIFSPLSSLTAPSQASLYKSSLQLTQTLFTFGKISTAIQVAAQYDKSVRSGTKSSTQHLQLLALDAFYGVVVSDISLDVSERSLSRKKELFEFLDRNFKLGSGSKAQLLLATADLKSEVPLVTKAKLDVLTAKMGLNFLIGHPLLDSVELDTAEVLQSLVSQPLPPEQEAVRTALASRQDLRSLEYLAQATRGGAKIYRAMYLPSIGATGSFGTQGSDPQDLTDWDSKTWSVGVGLQWTLFDGFDNSAKARQFASDARKLDIAHDEISKSVEIDIATALSACAQADSNLAAARDALAAAREGYTLTNENFEQGSGQLSDVKLAEERLVQAEMGNIAARYALVRSRAALRVAMGQDIITVEDK